MNYIYKANSNEAIQSQPKNGEKYTLEELQEIVGGYIQIIPLDNEEVAIIDEEGKIKHKFVNILADYYCKQHGWHPLRNDYIVGDVLICNENDID